RVHAGRLDRDQPVAEVGDVALPVGVEEVVQGRDQAHRVPELAQVRVRAELGEAGQGAGLLVPGGEPHRDGDPVGGVGEDHRPVDGPQHGEVHRGLPGNVDRLRYGLHRDLLAVELIRWRAGREVDVVLDIDPLVY